MAAERTRLLLSSYRKGDAYDADGWVASIAAILSTYPESVVRYVTDPRTGLAGESPYIPSAYDVRQACEALMRPVKDAARRMARMERDRIAPAPAHDRSAALQRLRASYPGVFSPKGETERRSEPPPPLTEYGHQPLAVSDALRARIGGSR